MSQFYHNGDLIVTLPTGEKRFIEVKNDSRIADTHNILCEEEVYYKEKGYFAPGFMYRDYDIYAVVSEKNKTIYFFDFAKLKEIYKNYWIDYKKLDYKDQYSNCYFVEMCRAKQFGAFIAKVNY